MKFIKRYKYFIVFVVINLLVLIFFPEVGKASIKITGENILEMISILPPIFILIGLFDVWIKRETLIKFMGKDSGIIGIFIAFFIGAAAAGPLYGAFPVAAVLLKKGAKLSNVFIMVGAWSTAKIPLLLFEASSLGIKFTLIRLFVNIFGILIIAFVIEKSLKLEDKREMLMKVESMVQ